MNPPRTASILLLLLASCPGAPAPRTNVLLVTLDTTRADFLSCYGGPPGLTPTLDGIAREGARFDLAVSTASLTPVSHASILTGLDNAAHGVRVLAAGSGCRLPADVPTLATVLKEAGLETAAFHSAFPVSSFYGFERGFDTFDSLEGTIEKAPAGNAAWNIQRLQRRSDETTDRALAWLSQGRRAFFAWIHYWDPHDGVKLPPPEYLPQRAPRTAEDLFSLSREVYAAEVRYMDAQLGRLVAELRRRGEWERTIVVVIADHGEGLGDHGWQHHRLLYQEQIRVPLIVRIPGAPSGRVVADLARATDVYPTILEALGIRSPRAIDGRGLRGLIDGREEPGRIALADQVNGYDWNARMVEERPLDDFLYCAMDARWKLVYRPAHPEASELFDLEGDPREARNLRAEEPAEFVRLLKELAARKPWVLRPFPPPTGATSAAQQALAGLGYAGGATPAAEADWAWTCPEHREWTSPEREPCPVCSAPPVPVRRG